MTNEKSHPTVLVSPFNNIALTFSGGGFRAASYSLGALSYLDYIKFETNEKTLLDNVTYSSSTSGGSITNALYSAYLHKGKSFKDVFKKLYNSLTGQILLDEVFAIMNDDGAWNNGGKSKSFINAFAKVYDKLLYDEETFAVFWNKTHVPEFEICLNATEFYRGLSFRFQTEGDNNQKQIIGNKYLHFNTKEFDTIKKIKLADMVAASSCFPAGFEPIVYPQDFSYETLSVTELNKAMLMETYQEEVQSITHAYGFMDGGITDNQGLYSAMLADKKRRNRVSCNPFDLIIVTDVASYFMDEYKEPESKLKENISTHNIDWYINIAKTTINKSVKKIQWSSIVAFLFFLGSIITMFITKNNLLQNLASFFCGFSLLLLVVILSIKKIKPFHWIFKNKNNIKSEKPLNDFTKKQTFVSEKLMLNLIHFLRFTKISILETMIKSRIVSMSSMLLDVNLKQTRRLIYEMFYNDDIWANRRLPNFIYELSTYNFTSRSNRFNNKFRLGWAATYEDKSLLLNNCWQLKIIAEEARTMGTTLWFDEKNEGKLKKIIATGQFTTCCNLLEYVISLERKGLSFDVEINTQLADLKEKLIADFLKFKQEPYFLFDEYSNA